MTGTLSRAPALPNKMEQRSMQRRRFKQADSLEIRLGDQAERLRKEAQGTYPGVERERLIRRARQAETAAQMADWLRPSGTPAPK
ncbi:hypothetical protein SAMN05444164_0486 [Bradyrhizobium erythrophlei]|uniref:Uncharacterized protein n=1 Tax=Bradyrhizobium erythrophlei TaxID=1437360 RepID=A0A1H4N0Y5_9BRAD|nr:hypothetical protein SAMN05444164_0486 [Bradyrhizobium erythrophlei]